MADIESIRKVALGPDDVVVVRCEGVTCDAEEGLVRSEWEQAFPKNKVVVVRGGQSLSVVSPEFIGKREFKPEDVERWFEKWYSGTENASKPLPCGESPLAGAIRRITEEAVAAVPPYRKDEPHDGESSPCNPTETRAGTMGIVEGEGVPMPEELTGEPQVVTRGGGGTTGAKRADHLQPSSVDRLKAEEAAKQEPQTKPAIDELLDACDELEGWMPEDPRLQRLINGVTRIRERQKADREPKPSSVDVVGELLAVVGEINSNELSVGCSNDEIIKGWFIDKKLMKRIERAASAVRRRRDELPPFDEKLARTCSGVNQMYPNR